MMVSMATEINSTRRTAEPNYVKGTRGRGWEPKCMCRIQEETPFRRWDTKKVQMWMRGKAGPLSLTARKEQCQNKNGKYGKKAKHTSIQTQVNRMASKKQAKRQRKKSQKWYGEKLLVERSNPRQTGRVECSAQPCSMRRLVLGEKCDRELTIPLALLFRVFSKRDFKERVEMFLLCVLMGSLWVWSSFILV